MPDYRLLVFDWDGTLADSISRIVESLRVAAETCGLPQLDESALKGIIGLGLPEAIRVLYPELVDPSSVERYRAAYGAHYNRLEVQPSALFPGVLEALEGFRNEGYLLAVATGKSRRGARSRPRGAWLAGLLRYHPLRRRDGQQARSTHAA